MDKGYCFQSEFFIGKKKFVSGGCGGAALLDAPIMRNLKRCKEFIPEIIFNICQAELMLFFTRWSVLPEMDIVFNQHLFIGKKKIVSGGCGGAALLVRI